MAQGQIAMTTYGLKILPVFPVIISDGVMAFKDNGKERLQKFILWNKGEFEMRIEKPRKHRSLKMNAYYFGVVVPIIADWMGEDDPDYIHALLKAMFLSRTAIIKGKEYHVSGKTSKLTTAQFGEYLERVIRWANLEGLVIPEADREYLAHELKAEMDAE